MLGIADEELPCRFGEVGYRVAHGRCRRGRRGLALRRSLGVASDEQQDECEYGAGCARH
jgi:hypothetical protein